METLTNTGRNDLHRFHADFWEDKVYISGRAFPAGHFIVELLNFYDMDLFATRAGLDEIRDLIDELERGFVRKDDVTAAKLALLERCAAIKKAPPFCYLDTDAYAKGWIDFLFRDMQYRDVFAYLKLKRQQADYLDPMELAMHLTADEKHVLYNGQYLLERWMETLDFYNWFYTDCLDALWMAKQFSESLEDIKKFDEHQLITKVQTLHHYGRGKYGLSDEYQRRKSMRAVRSDVEYFALQLPGKAKRNVTARRFYFMRAIDFFISDFYEGIHNGHYPKKCAVCGRYFLIEDGRNQKYCDGIAPNDPKKRTCRQVGADRKRREREKGYTHPIKKLCTTRLNSINQHKYRGKITPEFAMEARRIAQDCRDRALVDAKYARSQYKKDITQESIYAMTAANLQR